MELSVLVLYYLSSLAGAVMVVGGIVLLYKQKIYIDRESNQVTEIETPIGKFKTNFPALMLFALGFVPLIYPLWAIPRVPLQVSISGDLKSNVPVEVFAVAAHENLGAGPFTLSVPFMREGHYSVLFSVCPGGRVVPAEQPRSEAHGRFDVGEVNFQNESCAPTLRAIH